MRNNITIEDAIIKLSNIWYNLISFDHHKDKDCHWYIEKKWSYGEKPDYHVIHNGYIGDCINKNFSTSKEAHEFLLCTLKKYIKEQFEWAEDVQSESHVYDEIEQENSKRIMQIIKKNKHFLQEL